MEALTEPSTSLSFSKGGERRPKLLGKWKRNRLPTPMRPWISQNGGANRAERQACRSQREGKGVRNSVFRSLEASCARGTASEIRHPQGERRPEFAQIQEERRPKFNSIPWTSALQFTT